MTQPLQYLPAILATVFCLTVTPVLAVVSAPLTEGGPVVVVAGPGADLEAIVKASDGWLVGVSRAPMAVMGMSDSANFEDRLKENGAWAILDGRALSWLCGEQA
ncbi:hypothetical protein J7399_09110 [Shimia sp. R9_1]|jgi:hypothetical protein|uniref:hypothetical protein n=1 Tax=Shimia sp. R9_1 TaxID=2821111 RepID=UPI001ADA4744|nr:hypothetical protein [Shimia sp. R9_1]MBO9407585.1 hypothetical protein [Shimia sp. R9_1]